MLSSKWESLLNNLGHTARKLKKYPESLSYHQQALVLIPMSASTYSAIGYVQALQGDLVEAVEAFHKALSLRRDDTFSTNMLNNVIEQLMIESPPFHDYPEEVPKLDPVQPDTPLHHLPIHSSYHNTPAGEAAGSPADCAPKSKIKSSLSCDASTPYNESQDHENVNYSEMSIDIEMSDISNNDRTLEHLASQHDE